MSTSSGSAICSRNPPKCGRPEELRRGDRPTVPSDAARSRRAKTCGFHRRDWLTMNSSPVTSAAAARDSASARDAAAGFSPSTGSPANSAAGRDRVVRVRHGDVDERLRADGPGQLDGVRSRPGRRGRPSSSATCAGTRDVEVGEPGQRPRPATARMASSQARPMPAGAGEDDPSGSVALPGSAGRSSRRLPRGGVHAVVVGHRPAVAVAVEEVAGLVAQQFGCRRSGRSVRAHATPLAMTRRTSLWW